MNTYIVFNVLGLERLALLIAPCDEKYYRGSAVEVVTDTAVESSPCDAPHIRAIDDGILSDREAAICRAREWIAWRRAADARFTACECFSRRAAH
jgi:hypothetical protein